MWYHLLGLSIPFFKTAITITLICRVHAQQGAWHTANALPSYDGPTRACFCGLGPPSSFLVHVWYWPSYCSHRVLPTASTSPGGATPHGTRIRQVPDCPDTGKVLGVNPGEYLWKTWGTQDTAPLAPVAWGYRTSRSEANQGSCHQSHWFSFPDLWVQQVPVLVLTVTASSPSICLCQFSAVMFTVNNALSQTAYGLGRVWDSRGTDSQLTVWAHCPNYFGQIRSSRAACVGGLEWVNQAWGEQSTGPTGRLAGAVIKE